MNAVRLRVCAPAKINLHLEVQGLRGDGYHEVRTILQSVALADTLVLRARPGPLTVRSRTRAMPRDGENLIWRAAAALWRALARSGDPSDVAVTVRKVVPAGAGLGGASSDAASALRALRRMWAPEAPDGLLREVAAEVGSDVPFFLVGGTVLATGRGELMRRLKPVGPYEVVIAVPGFEVSTAAAYRWWDEDGGGSFPDAGVPDAGLEAGGPAGGPVPSAGLEAGGPSGGPVPSAGLEAGGPVPDAGLEAGAPRWRNDLAAPVWRRHPEIGEMVQRLRAASAVRAGMTGSGSAVFGLFRTVEAAERARRAVRRRGWRTVQTRTVDARGHDEIAAVARTR